MAVVDAKNAWLDGGARRRRSAAAAMARQRCSTGEKEGEESALPSS